MHKIIAIIGFLLIAVTGASAQECNASFTLTATGRAAIIRNTTTRCERWVVSYVTTGATASVSIDASTDGTEWAAMNSRLPSTTVPAGALATVAYAPFVSVSAEVAAGKTVTGQLRGWRTKGQQTITMTIPEGGAVTGITYLASITPLMVVRPAAWDADTALVVETSIDGAEWVTSARLEPNLVVYDPLSTQNRFATVGDVWGRAFIRIRSLDAAGVEVPQSTARKLTVICQENR